MSFMDYFKDLLKTNVRRTLRDIEADARMMATEFASKVQRMVIKQVMALFFICVALFLFSLAAVFFMIEYLALTKTLAFLFIGVILLLIGLIIKVL